MEKILPWLIKTLPKILKWIIQVGPLLCQAIKWIKQVIRDIQKKREPG